MKIAYSRTATVFACLFLGAFAAPLPVEATPPVGSGLTNEQVAELPIADQIRILGPLRNAANALGAVGRADRSGLFAGLTLDTARGEVDLYLTNPGRGAGFVAAAARTATFDTKIVRVLPAHYSLSAAESARDRLISQSTQQGLGVTSVAIPSDASRLDVGIAPQVNYASSAQLDHVSVGSGGASASRLQAVAGMPVSVRAAPAATNQSRYADFSPYFSGGYITTSVNTACTTGLTVHNQYNSYLMTAAHCAHTGDWIYNGNGDLEGKVIGYSDQ